MIFRFIAPLAVLILTGWLTFRRFKKSAATAYLPWLIDRAKAILSGPGPRALVTVGRACLAAYSESWLRWAAIGLASSFFYLAASGLGFAVFSHRGLHGLPLLLHVIAGGVFAASLAVIIVFRSRFHLSFSPPGGLNNPDLRSYWKSLSRQFLQSAVFWIFGVSGLALIITSLGSMLPYFSYEAQLDLLVVHRYAALISILAAMVWLDTVLSSEN
jgi:hypothetical protein